ncbi:MAG: DUF2914 domain-containing protein [Gammaproteobacteria bacterium]|nr:DUF2914 domain-containing protein [Gammaproteobacteria bacterium]
MSAKTLKIKISLGSGNGSAHKPRLATTQEIDHTNPLPDSKLGQPVKLAVFLTFSIIAIMSWLFFAPTTSAPTTTPLLSTSASTINQDLTPTSETVTQKINTKIPPPTVAVSINPKIASTSEPVKSLEQPTPQVKIATHSPVKTAMTSNTLANNENNIARALFTNGISKREPIDKITGQLTAAPQELKKLYYFTELRGLKGQTITHQWQYDNKVVAEIEFKVRGNRWRVYSSKYLQPHKKGDWQVIVKNGKGNPLETSQFTYQ